MLYARVHGQIVAGQPLGLREVDDQVWQVSFMDCDLGCFDKEEGRVKPGPNPFVPGKVPTMCLVNTRGKWS